MPCNVINKLVILKVACVWLKCSLARTDAFITRHLLIRNYKFPFVIHLVKSVDPFIVPYIMCVLIQVAIGEIMHWCYMYISLC